MKKTILTAITFFIVISLFAQPSQNFNYQGVLRNDAGSLAINENINIIVEYYEEGSAFDLYAESFNTTTNEFGEFNIVLFDGSLISGSKGDVLFEDYNVEVNITINGTDLGATVIRTVPYAFEAGNAFISQTSLYAIDAFEAEQALYANDAGNISNTTSSPSANTLYGNSGALAYGQFDGFAGVVNTDFGITSITRTSIGVYEIVCDNNWMGRPVVLVTSFNFGNQVEDCTYESATNGNSISVYITDENGAPKDSDFSMVVFGIAQ